MLDSTVLLSLQREMLSKQFREWLADRGLSYISGDWRNANERTR